MAYTALEEMRIINIGRIGRECGPFQPEYYQNGQGWNMKTAALRFLRERCEGLRFGSISVAEEMASGKLTGTSLKENQIPYNMQMDIDRICLEKALEQFIDSGTAEDAYAVYYCYLEMFVGSYGKSKHMVELLSEFESNGSSLLMKHRDHYSHSVYVFALGLAIYETNEQYRKAFRDFYGPKEKEAHAYLQFWGLTALFHDIGYPFELPFEQVMSYFEVDQAKRGAGIPYLAYHCLDDFLRLSEDEQGHFEKLFGRKMSTSTEVLAHDISRKLSESYDFTESYMLDQINHKPTNPESYSYFMDHAFFSATRLFRELVQTIGVEAISPMHIDALSAILLHNSLFKFSVSFYKAKPPKKKAPLSMNLHPLAYMLMLCDELQCWDRTAYGRSSRTLLYPMSADFDLRDGGIRVCYHYDIAQQHKIQAFHRSLEEFNAGNLGKKPRLKAYSDMTGKNDFAEEIRDIVDLGGIPFEVTPDLQPEDRSKKHTYLSDSSFLHLYDFAVLLSVRRKLCGEEPELQMPEAYGEFDRLSLEYKLSHIERAKYFSRYLHQIGCFYTDRPVDFDMLTEFSPEQLDKIAPLEHSRWLFNKQYMGWIYGADYENCPLPEECKGEKQMRQCLRERLRCHKLMIPGELTQESAIAHYHSLPAEEQEKDIHPMNWMLRLICRLDGVKIYKLW